jgi:hypothetical protein
MTEAVSPSLYLCKDVILWELHDDSVQGCDSKAFAGGGRSRRTPPSGLTPLILRTLGRSDAAPQHLPRSSAEYIACRLQGHTGRFAPRGIAESYQLPRGEDWTLLGTVAEERVSSDWVISN